MNTMREDRPTVTIERARPEDMEEVYALLRRSDLPVEGLEEHASHTLVARGGTHAGEVLGSAALEMYGRYALLRSVAVDERLRGQGIGQRLTRAALDLARHESVKHVYLLTETAAGFFPRFGFAPVAREDVPAPVHQSLEFTTLCPASSLIMGLNLEGV
jgi:amino-acid N-acetyltransferase